MLFFVCERSASRLYLSDTCFADRVFYCNSGTEANEGAIKFARKLQKVRAEAAGETEWAGGFRRRRSSTVLYSHRKLKNPPDTRPISSFTTQMADPIKPAIFFNNVA